MDSQFNDEEYDYLLNLCKDFAEKEYETTKYQRQRRNQSNRQLIIHQTTVGKMGEYAVMFHLLLQGHEVNIPDMEVTFQKSFDSDLVWNKRNLHVKTQDDSQTFYTSWMFQKGG